ncbi:MAG: amino acid ABC transporter substrate-binding protein, partial [Rhodocyclales bacterium]|nr:amino acid ABC transporter substrate-binding protein [Rhodocyclales bacterium]
MRHLHRTLAPLALGLLAVFSLPAQAGKTLDSIKQKGQLACGVSTGVIGFSAADSQGQWHGLDADFCRALATAVLGDPNKVRWVPLGSQQRFTALQSGEVDVLARNTTWSLSRDAGQGMLFAGINYYDGQGFLVPKKLKITSAKQLKNAEICVQSGTTTEKNLADYFRAQNIKVKPVVFDKFEPSLKAFFSGRCQAYTTDA